MDTNKLDEFLNSLEISDSKKKSIKKLFINQTEYLSDKKTSDESVEDLSKIDLNVFFGAYIGINSGFKSIKEGIDDLFNSNKKDSK